MRLILGLILIAIVEAQLTLRPFIYSECFDSRQSNTSEESLVGVNTNLFKVTEDSVLNDDISKDLKIKVVGQIDSTFRQSFNITDVFVQIEVFQLGISVHQNLFRTRFCELLKGITCDGIRSDFEFDADVKLSSLIPFTQTDIQIKFRTPQTLFGCTLLTFDGSVETYMQVIWALTATIIPSLGFLLSFFWFYRKGKKDIFRYVSGYEVFSDQQILRTPGVFDLIFFLQFIACTGLLSITYPLSYLSFSSMYRWSLLFFDYPRTSESFWYPIFKALRPTQLNDFTNRKSVYNYSVPVLNLNQLPALNPAQSINPVSGISNFAANIFISPYDIYSLVLITFILVLVAILFVSAILVFFADSFKLSTYKETSLIAHRKSAFIYGILNKMILLAFIPLCLFSFYHITIPDQLWLQIIAGILTVSLFIILPMYTFYNLLAKKSAAYLFNDYRTMLVFGGWYNHLKQKSTRYVVAIYLEKIMTCVILGLIQSRGDVQVVLWNIVEGLIFLWMIYQRPYISRDLNNYQLVIQAAKCVILLLFLPLLDTFERPLASREIVSFLQIILILFVFILFLLLVLFHIFRVLFGKKSDLTKEEAQPEPTPDDTTPVTHSHEPSIHLPYQNPSHHAYSSNSLNNSTRTDLSGRRVVSAYAESTSSVPVPRTRVLSTSNPEPSPLVPIVPVSYYDFRRSAYQPSQVTEIPHSYYPHTAPTTPQYPYSGSQNNLDDSLQRTSIVSTPNGRRLGGETPSKRLTQHINSPSDL